MTDITKVRALADKLIAMEAGERLNGLFDDVFELNVEECETLDKMMAGKPRPPMVIAVSGGFDPVHIGHVRMIHEAKMLAKSGSKLVVILNNDNWLKRKKQFVFMPQDERAEILMALQYVDQVVITDHAPDCEDMSVSDTLRTLRPDVFANGGDRAEDIPEFALCQQLGILMRFNVGGGKVQSSSWLTGSKH